MIGWSGGTSMPMEITLMPWASGGIIFLSSPTSGALVDAEHLRDVGAVDVGVHEAHARALARRATARFTAVVDLPTPPLPAPTAMMLRMPGHCLAAEAAARLHVGRHLRARRA